MSEDTKAWEEYRKKAIESAINAGQITVELTDSFTFTIPDGHAQAGQEIEKDFTYTEVLTSDAALKLIEDKKWEVQKMVNKELKSNARSNAYQNSTAAYKPTKQTVDDLRATLIRTYIRLGLSEEVATAQADGVINANNG